MNQYMILVAVASAAGTWLVAAQGELPPARARHHMVYDVRQASLVVFGGAQRVIPGGARDTALWTLTNERWQSVPTTYPVRGNAAAAYDPDRHMLVVHGGSSLVPGSPGELDDTWEWDGRTWRLAAPAGPGARAHHSMVYDAARRQLLLFGNSDGAIANDTWGWNGQEWKRLANDGPPRRGLPALTYDAKRGVVVMFGGAAGPRALMNDTWEWNGQTWTQVQTAAAPSPRYDTSISYDAARSQIVLFGGRTAAGNVGDTWTYDGKTWTEREAAGPGARNGHAMAYDPTRARIALFGGRNEPEYFNDFWSFDGTWRRVAR